MILPTIFQLYNDFWVDNFVHNESKYHSSLSIFNVVGLFWINAMLNDYRYLRSAQSWPTGKHNFPRPVSVCLPQSLGKTSSVPCACGAWVPSSVKDGPTKTFCAPLNVCLNMLPIPANGLNCAWTWVRQMTPHTRDATSVVDLMICVEKLTGLLQLFQVRK